jgi:two-component system, cell cycle sensor histidine kinase and response regulator CckA
MLARLIGEDLVLKFKPAPGPGWVMIDPVQIEQVIFNLAVNARDAMPGGGVLLIETADFILDESYAEAHPALPKGPYVIMTVSDTGIGMDRETQKRIFEPFFTTKGKDKGTGLGLATVYGVIKQAGGGIMVYSEPGAGTTFKVLLPRVAPSGEQAKHPLPPTRPAGRGETILLVEDDDLVRQTAASILTANGYAFIPAPSGEQGLQIFTDRSAEIALVITDLIMPGINGRQMIQRLRAQRPDLRFIYVSGYTDEILSPQGVLEPGANFIHKPFETAHLLAKVRAVLDAPP